MNYRNLSNQSMLSTSASLLHDARARALLDGDEMGRACANQLASAHAILGNLFARRYANDEALARLIAELTALDSTHDRRARAFFLFLSGILESEDDPQIRALCQKLLSMCFPDGTAIVNSTYCDEAGWCVAMQMQIGPALLAEMDAIPVGTRTLGQVCREWIDAGVHLGAKLNERTRLESAIAKTGAAAGEINVSTVRSLWIRSMRAVVASIALMNLSDADRNLLMSPIRRAVLEAERRRLGLDEDDGSGSPIDDVSDEAGDGGGDSPIDDVSNETAGGGSEI